MASIAFALVVCSVLSGGPADPEAPEAAPAVDEGELTLEADDGGDERAWSFSASAYGYFVDGDDDYGALTLMADRGWLHLEARYNYEDLHTASLWIGYNFEVGEKFTFALTPMFGGIFGDTDGIAPGYEMTLGYKWIELYTEGEFVFDLDSSDDDYFYSWSELTVSPADWIYGGLAAQRTRLRDEDGEVDLGPMLGFAYKWAELTFYLFEPGGDDQTFVTALTFGF